MAAMVLMSFLCILFGVWPQLLYEHLPYPVEYEAYTASKVVFYTQLLLFSGLAFFLLLPLMRRTDTISLDADWLWRVLLFRTASLIGRAITGAGAIVGTLARSAGNRIGGAAGRGFGSADGNEGSLRGVFARSWPIGVSALWIAVLLSAYVLFYYLAT